MGRKKIVIERITDDRNRSVTFQKRKTGLMKKAMELSILCDCEIALFVINAKGKLFQYATRNNIEEFVGKCLNEMKPQEYKTNDQLLTIVKEKEERSKYLQLENRKKQELIEQKASENGYAPNMKPIITKFVNHSVGDNGKISSTEDHHLQALRPSTSTSNFSHHSFNVQNSNHSNHNHHNHNSNHNSSGCSSGNVTPVTPHPMMSSLFCSTQSTVSTPTSTTSTPTNSFHSNIGSSSSSSSSSPPFGCSSSSFAPQTNTTPTITTTTTTTTTNTMNNSMIGGQQYPSVQQPPSLSYSKMNNHGDNNNNNSGLSTPTTPMDMSSSFVHNMSNNTVTNHSSNFTATSASIVPSPRNLGQVMTMPSTSTTSSNHQTSLLVPRYQTSPSPSGHSSIHDNSSTNSSLQSTSTASRSLSSNHSQSSVSVSSSMRRASNDNELPPQPQPPQQQPQPQLPQQQLHQSHVLIPPSSINPTQSQSNIHAMERDTENNRDQPVPKMIHSTSNNNNNCTTTPSLIHDMQKQVESRSEVINITCRRVPRLEQPLPSPSEMIRRDFNHPLPDGTHIRSPRHTSLPLLSATNITVSNVFLPPSPKHIGKSSSVSGNLDNYQSQQHSYIHHRHQPVQQEQQQQHFMSAVASHENPSASNVRQQMTTASVATTNQQSSDGNLKKRRFQNLTINLESEDEVSEVKYEGDTFVINHSKIPRINSPSGYRIEPNTIASTSRTATSGDSVESTMADPTLLKDGSDATGANKFSPSALTKSFIPSRLPLPNEELSHDELQLHLSNSPRLLLSGDIEISPSSYKQLENVNTPRTFDLCISPSSAVHNLFYNTSTRHATKPVNFDHPKPNQ